MTSTETFAAWLKGKRSVHKESYQTLSQRAGVSVATPYMIEKGETSPSLETADKLAKAYGTSLEAALRVRTPKKVPNLQPPAEAA